MTSRELRRRVPSLVEAFGPLELARLPTPITEVADLARLWGCSSLHVKRDDLSSPLYGGSKVRSLEWLLGRARRRGHRGVVTLGPWGSHHALATAVFAQRAGLLCRVVLFPQPDRPEVPEIAAALHAAGAETIRLRTYLGLPIGLLRARRRRLGGRVPGFIAPGGAEIVGVLGTAEGGFELARAVEKGLLAPPDDVVVPAGSCGTAAGVLLGCALGGLRARVVAVRVGPHLTTRRSRVLSLARGTARLLTRHGWPDPIQLGPLALVHDQVGRGYARPTTAALRAQEQVEAATELRGDGVYTSKAWAALASGEFSDRRVLYWHTLSAISPLEASRRISSEIAQGGSTG